MKKWICGSMMVMAISAQSHAATYTWSNSGSLTPWFTSTNWTANVTSGAWTTADVAQFQNTGSASTAGIDFSAVAGAFSIGAVEVTSARTRGLTIGNSSATSGVLTLNGATVNSVNDVIIRNAGSATLTFQDNETGTGKVMGLALGNATNNVIVVDGSGGLTLGSSITGSGKQLTIQGSGTGLVTFQGVSRTSTVVSGNATIAMADTTGISTNMSVSGTGIPSGAYITAINPGVSITISAAPTSAGTSVSIGGNFYTGGTTISNSSGKVRVAYSSAANGGTILSGPLGTGNLTLSNGAYLYSTSATILYHPTINLNGNIQIGDITTSGRLQFGGAWDLGGSGRSITLAKTSAINSNFSSNGALQLVAIPGGANPTVGNGTLTVLNKANSGSDYSIFGNTSTTTYTSNSGLVIGDHVITIFGTGTPFATGTGAPAVTVNSGGILNLSDGNTATRSVEIYSLAGSGTVTNYDFGTVETGTLTINNGNGQTFSGNIIDGQGTAVSIMAVTKSGAGTQTFSGNNSYTGGTNLNGGTLVVDSSTALGSSGTISFGGGTLQHTANNTTDYSGRFSTRRFPGNQGRHRWPDHYLGYQPYKFGRFAGQEWHRDIGADGFGNLQRHHHGQWRNLADRQRRHHRQPLYLQRNHKQRKHHL